MAQQTATDDEADYRGALNYMAGYVSRHLPENHRDNLAEQLEEEYGVTPNLEVDD